MINRKTPFNELPEFLTVEEFGLYLGLGRTTAYELLKTKKVSSQRFGRRIFIPKSQLKQSA